MPCHSISQWFGIHWITSSNLIMSSNDNNITIFEAGGSFEKYILLSSLSNSLKSSHILSLISDKLLIGMIKHASSLRLSKFKPSGNKLPKDFMFL